MALFTHVEMASSAWEMQLAHMTNLAQQTPTRYQVRPPANHVLQEAIVLLVQATYSRVLWDGFVWQELLPRSAKQAPMERR